MGRKKTVVEEEDVELSYSHKFIENSPTYGTTCPEISMNADKRTQDSNRERKSWNRVGPKKDGKKQRGRKVETNQVRTYAQGESWKKRKNKQTNKIPHPEKSPSHQWGDQPRQRRNFGVLEENTAIELKQLKWKWSSTNSQCHCPALPNQRQGGRGQELKFWLWRSDSDRKVGLGNWGNIELVSWWKPGGTGVSNNHNWICKLRNPSPFCRLDTIVRRCWREWTGSTSKPLPATSALRLQDPNSPSSMIYPWATAT